MSYEAHETMAAGIKPRCAVVTLSDSRRPQTDTSGQTIVRLLTEADAAVVDTKLMPDEPDMLRQLLVDWLDRPGLDLILTTGGTGISTRDHTIDVLETFIETPLPGFGELFRMLSWEQIGAGAILSRAAGGVAKGKLLFGLPGSPAAVELAMSQLILPAMKHLLRELRR